MGIDIYLNGYEAYKKRTEAERSAFDKAVKERDCLPRDSKAAEAAQVLVRQAADVMWSGSVGYLRSSYNSSGLFRVLEEIFGFDVGEYFFPGDWSADVKIDGREFVAKVETLRRVTLLALRQDRKALPWIDLYTEVTDKAAPDANQQRTDGELFGDKVFSLISGMGADHVEGGPREPEGQLSERHAWYLTHGLKSLSDFGELAEELNRSGVETFAYISY